MEEFFLKFVRYIYIWTHPRQIAMFERREGATSALVNENQALWIVGGQNYTILHRHSDLIHNIFFCL